MEYMKFFFMRYEKEWKFYDYNLNMGQKYWQHFLSDISILESIAREIEDFCKTHTQITSLIEIGPGQWALTKYLPKLEKQLFCYEVDTSMEQKLQKYQKQYKSMEVIRWDFLQQDISHYHQETTLVVGNLPYYITSPIFRKCYEENSFLGGVFLIQKEVATKIMTAAKKKSYLWRLLNNNYEIDYCFTVPASAFTPPPKVESAVVKFKIHESRLTIQEYGKLLEILDQISPYKRKTLGKIAKMTGIKIPEEYQGLRLEELGWEEMLCIIQNEKCKI